MSRGQSFCPRFREAIDGTYSRETCDFLLNLQNSNESAHRNCIPAECLGRVSWKENRPTHTKECSNCDLLGPSMAKIKSCIEEDGIPLLRFHRSRGGALEIEVVRAAFESRYVAVSHVWSGGLGNPIGNKLHECQLVTIAATGKQIQRIISKGRRPSFPKLFRKIHNRLVLGDIDLFWIDTLCIPVREYEARTGTETKQSRDMRTKAINRMTHIYAGAHSVLVIDPEIRNLDNELVHEDPDEFFGRMIRSDWMRRCWTFQEGAMAGRLFALLSTEPVYLTRLRYQITESSPRTVSARRKELTEWISKMPGPRQTTEYESRNHIIGRDEEIFAVLWTTLLSRTTSQEADRYLIFALMMGFLIGPLLELRSDLHQQIRVIFNSLQIIPLDFIYRETEFCEEFWLPDHMVPQSFSGHCLVRNEWEEDYFVLSGKSLKPEGTRSEVPGLYCLKEADLQRGEVPISTTRGRRTICFPRHAELGNLRNFSPDCILVRDIEGPSTDNVADVVFFRSLGSNDTEEPQRLQRLCAIKCSLVTFGRLQHLESYENLLSSLPERCFHILCNFQNCARLPVHRNPVGNLSLGIMIPSWYMDLTSGVFVLIFLYVILAGLIMCIPSAISVPPTWFVLFVYVVCIPLIGFAFEYTDRSRRLGENVMHSNWIDNLTPDAPATLPRRVRLMRQINHGRTWTCLQLMLGVLFTVLGITYRQNSDRRVMIVFGIYWLYELALRWGFELLHNYYYATDKSHPLLAEILRDSTLTKWCKRLFGWPKELETDSSLLV